MDSRRGYVRDVQFILLYPLDKAGTDIIDVCSRSLPRKALPYQVNEEMEVTVVLLMLEAPLEKDRGHILNLERPCVCRP